MRIPGLGGGDATIQVLVDRQDVLAGGTMQATVRVSAGSEATEITEGRVRLVCDNRYLYRYSSGQGARTGAASDVKVVAEHRFLPEGAVVADSEHAIELTVPTDAQPSAQGKITRVLWKVEATLARPRARDISDELPVEVLSRADETWTPPDSDVDAQGECELSLELAKLAFGACEPIEGTLVASASDECEVGELRVELEREERVPRGSGNTSHVREASVVVAGRLELSPGLPVEHAFRVEVPPDPVATLKTEASSVRWLLRGVGSRRMQSDYNVTQEVLVYSAPGEHLGL